MVYICSWNRIPPAKKQHPNTSKQLDSIDPIIAACTKRNSPFTSANIAIISSTVLPNVAFNKPPNVCPTLNANSSVAKPSSAASGMIAANETQNVAVSLTPEK